VSAPVKDIILVRSLGIDLTFSETSCSDPSLPTVVPSGATVLFADCGAYARFVGSITGPLRPLLTAPAGTVFEWTNAAGLQFSRALTGTETTVTRDPRTGQFPGHGMGPSAPRVLIQLRNGTQQTELTAS
jgi:hypothetical protein